MLINFTLLFFDIESWNLEYGLSISKVFRYIKVDSYRHLTLRNCHVALSILGVKAHKGLDLFLYDTFELVL